MTQSRSTSFHEAIAARGNNTRFRVMPAGIYRGFFAKPNSTDPSQIDIVRGNDGESTLLTTQGVMVTEDSDLIAVVAPTAADKSFDRIDLLVVEYQFTTNTAIEAEYKIIKGVAIEEALLAAPALENEFQIPLATVRIPKNSLSTVIIADDGVLRSPLASDTEQDELSALRPFVDPTQIARLYVQPGSYPNASQNQILLFNGGYTPSIDSSVIAVGGSRVFVFGIDDSQDLAIVEDVADFASIGDATPATYLLAAVLYRKDSSSNVTVQELRDLRVGVGRLGIVENEIDAWTDLLTDSAFTNMAIEVFNDDTAILPAAFSFGAGDPQIGGDPSNTDNDLITVTIDRATSSLVVNTTATASVTGGVTIKLNDILKNDFSVQNFSLYVDSDVDIGFTFSTTSTTDSSYTTAEKVASPLGTADIQDRGNAVLVNFFPRLHISETTLTANGGIVSIRGLALMANLESAASTKLIAASDALTNVDLNLYNLVGNPFVIWSRPDNSGNFPDLLGGDLDYDISVDADDHANYVLQFGPDGWFRADAIAGIKASVRRENPSTAPFIPAITIDSLSGLGPFNFEYRIPFGAQYRGQEVTFSCDILSEDWAAGGTAGLDIAIYDAGGRINVPVTVSVRSNNSQRITVSSTGIPDTCIAIGFRLVIDGDPVSPNIGRTVFSSPMAAWGKFTALPFVPSRNAAVEAAMHYEVARITVGGYATQGTRVQASHPVLRKALEMGTLRARIVPNNNFSENLSTVTVLDDAFNKNRVNVSGVVEQTGQYLIDVVYESAVLPTRTTT